MSSVNNNRRYIVITKDGENKIIRQEELESVDIQNIIYSEIEINFYETLPPGIYKFNGKKIKVDTDGNIKIGRKVITKEELTKK